MKQGKNFIVESLFGINFILRIYLLLLFKKIATAENLIKKLICSDSNHSITYHCYLGLIYKKQLKIKEAIEEYKKTLELDPDDPWTCFDLVQLSYKLGRYSEVLKYGEALLEKKYSGMKNFAKTQLLFQLPWYLGMAYSYQGEYEKAITYLNRTFDNKMDDKDKAVILEKLGYCYRELNRFDDALVNLKKAIELSPNLYYAHFSLGFLFDKLEQYEKAIPEFLEALKGDFNNKATNCMLSRAYYITEQFDESEKYMRKLIQLYPKESKFYLLLGDISERKQNYQSAIENYKKALELKPDDEEAKLALESAKADSWKTGINIERWGFDFGQHSGTF